jgi:hypothetical protein
MENATNTSVRQLKSHGLTSSGEKGTLQNSLQLCRHFLETAPYEAALCPILYSLLRFSYQVVAFCVSHVVTHSQALSQIVTFYDKWSFLAVGCNVSHPASCIFTRGHT